MNLICSFINSNYINNKINLILKLDFNKNINRLLYKKLKTHNDACVMFEMYKSYLIIRYLYQNEHLPPPGIVDEGWHDHILDTKKYNQDCMNIFGYYLHHYPYHGINGELIGLKEQKQAYEKLDSYYIQIFNYKSYDLYQTLKRKINMSYPKKEIITVIDYLQNNKTTNNETLRKELVIFLAEQEMILEKNKYITKYDELNRKQSFSDNNQSSQETYTKDDYDDSGWHGNTCG